MGVHLGSDDEAALRARLSDAAVAELTYPSIGMSLERLPPTGYRVGDWSAPLGWGPKVFERGQEALRDWSVHRGAGIRLLADGPLAVGTNVVMAVPFGPAFVEADCRLVALIDEPDRFGFAYGTLPNHPEQGEESFRVLREPNGYVAFAIRAVSKHRHPLARLVPPVAHRVQSHFTGRYLAAMRRCVGTE